jgi:Tfp pilus assembly protein PilV
MERHIGVSRIKGESRININSKIKSIGRTKGKGGGGARSCRGTQGFSLVEQLISLLIVALAAVLLIRMSAANAIVSQHSARRMSAVRLGSELSAWIQRGGHLALGTSIDQALDDLRTAAVNADTSTMCCPPDGCDARSSAWQYLSLWHSRLIRSIPDTRLMICLGETSTLTNPDWSCESQGSVLIMKLGWPVTAAMPSIVMPLGSIK